MLKSKKELLRFALIIIVIIAIALVSTLYIVKKEFREIVDKYILGKEIDQENANTITIEGSGNSYVYAIDDHVAVLSGNSLKMYNSSGKETQNLDMTISKPIFESNGKYLVVAENGGRKLYIVSGNNVLWEKELEGSISKVTVNKNGYVSVVLIGTSYKVVIATYNGEGKELFSTYLATTYSVDIDLSDDNKYLAIAEANSSGTTIKSGIKIVSIEKAQTVADEAFVYDKQDMNNQLITGINYQDGLVYMYENGISQVKNEKTEDIIQFREEDIFADINLNSSIVKVSRKNSSIFNTETSVEIINTVTKGTSIYTLEGVPKSIYTKGNTIALNMGTEIHFIGTNGWLIKKYVSSQEIKDIVLGSNIAGIVGKNKVEIIGL